MINDGKLLGLNELFLIPPLENASDLLLPLERGLSLAIQQLQDFAQSPDFNSKVKIAFGDTADLTEFQNAWAAGDFSALPKIKIIPAAKINGANGAYAAALDTIYISQGFLSQNTGNIEAVASLLREEIGHGIDAQVNREDSPGDEGAIFASLFGGNLIRESDLNQLKLEKDIITTVIDGKTLSLEQDTDIFLTLDGFIKPTGIYVDEQQNVYITYNVIVEEAFTISQHTVLAKYTPDGSFVNWISIPFITDFRFAFLPNSRDFLALRKDGAIFTVNPDTLQFSYYLDMKTIEIDNSSIYDITNNTLDTSRVIQPQFSQYNDIAVRQNGSITEIFVTGQGGLASLIPFVTRISIENNTVAEARILIDGERYQSPPVGDEEEYSYGTVSLPPSGIAVNSQGQVLTTFPILLPGRKTTSIHLVKFDADFTPEQGRNNVSFLDDGFFSFGMTSDSQGNFYILRNGQLGQSSVAVLPPNTNQYSYVEELGIPSIIGGSLSTGDIAVDSTLHKAYVAFDFSILSFSTSEFSNPIDNPPIVVNPIADVTVLEDAENQTIDLSNVFEDIDSDNIKLTIANNSNSELVTLSLEGNDLILDFLDNQFGIADVTIRAAADGQSVDDTFTVTVNPVDDPPVVANPIADLTVKENAENQTIDLSSVFEDIDSDTIELEVTNNTNSNLVTPLLEGDDLSLDFLDNQSGRADITIRANADGQSVDDTFTVTVNSSSATFDTPINRFQNKDISGTYLFAGEEESKNIRANFPNFTEEGFAFNVASQSGANLQALYRFQSLITPGTYLFAGEQERISINQNFSEAFREEGLAFYVYGAGTGLGEEFIRFQNSDRPGTYLFAGEEEAKSIRANFPNFDEEGVAFEVVV